jgi:hypothetical protein
MSANVFANGMEVSCKKSDNQSIAAMPDVCLSPPSPPAGPIPIPYPNFSQASDTSDGTKSVKLSGQEAGIKNESNYKTSKGDEAATKTLGMGTVTHTIQGTTIFAAWSMDVKFEGSNVPRFGDITTHNHSNPPNLAQALNNGSPSFEKAKAEADCEELREKNKQLHDSKPPPPVYQFKDKYTLTTAQYSSPSGKSCWNMKAFSKKIKGKGSSSWSKGAKKSGLCDGHKYGGGYQPASAHTEARIVEDLFKRFNKVGMAMGEGANLGTLKLNIHWKQKDGTISPDPCDPCRTMLCKAQKCGLKILLCDASGKSASPLECP